MQTQEFNTILKQQEARNKIKEGVKIATELVSPTLGHSSRRVLIDQSFGEIISSDDGTTILDKTELEDSQENLGLKIARECAGKTNQDEGDGTTTTTIILNELVQQLLKGNDKDDLSFKKVSGANLKVRKQIQEGLKKVLDYIDKNKIEITNNEQIAFVGKVSSNDANIGNILAEIFEKLGKDGAVSVEEGKSTETTHKIVEGMSFNQGWIAPQFVTDPEREEAVLDDGVNILVSCKKLQDVEDVEKIAELVRTGINNMLIIADDVSGVPLNSMVANKLMGHIRVAAVKAPQSGGIKDILADVCAATGATLIGDEVQIKDLTKAHLGGADRVVVSKDKTVIVGFSGDKEKINERISQLENRKLEQESEYEKEKLTERISKLKTGVGSIKVGGNTPMEIKDKKAKIDDAVSAVKSALRGGIVSGGGVALLLASQVIDDNEGENILKKAIQKPFEQILENADIYDNLKDKVLESGEGYNTETEEFCDMVKSGIIDPANVVKSAVSNAVSSALMISNLGASVNLVRKVKDNNNQENA